jgi:hypothetical protein
MHLAAEVHSFQRGSAALTCVLGHGLSAKSLERLVGQIGKELAGQRASSLPDQEVVVPAVSVVSCDGGRIHTREPNHGAGVHEARWRETKCALFERMESTESPTHDPCPALPETFRHVAHVAKIAEKAPFQADSPEENRPAYEGPKRVLRTCLSSLVTSAAFGEHMRQEASRRRFFEASRRVFLGDGLPWNWSIWREHFPTFTPILDFIHAVQYLYAAAAAWESEDARRWQRYLALAEAVWQGCVAEVIAQLRDELAQRGILPEDDVPEGSRHQPLVDAARYLSNNLARMDYPAYRRAGLPITSAPMESLIKQINLRVKGTEMFWNAPDGAEAILQLRAAALCDDGRLDDYLKTRPGCPYVRRTHYSTVA